MKDLAMIIASLVGCLVLLAIVIRAAYHLEEDDE